jgi:hypothetical protein
LTIQRTTAERLIKELGLLQRPGMPTFDQFVHQWLPRRVLDMFFSFDGGKQGPASSAMVQMLYPVLISLKAGDPILKVMPDLIQSLRDTEIPDLPVELLKTPFEAFRIEVPMKTFAEPAEQVQEIHVSSVEGDRFRVVFSQGEYSHYVSIMTSNPEQRIDEAIDQTMKDSLTRMPLDLWQEIKKEAMYADYFKADVFRFAVNLTLYVTCPEADMYQDNTKRHELHQKLQGMKGGRRRDVLLRKLAQEKSRKIYIVGANVRLSKEYSAELTETGRSWVLKHRVKVMGHWRQQPYGPNKSLRKPKWIVPHWRGPTYAEMVEKGYIVK